MRADAIRNRERLLEAAVELILEVSGEPARDAIAHRAGVGIGTLYRHFPDQQSLLHAVARHVLERTLTAGEAALASAANGAEALRQYVHLAVDHGLGAVNLIYRLLDRPDWPELSARAGTLLHALVDRAQSEGRMRRDVTARDVGFAILRACRPLGVGLPLEEERAIAHRHLDIYLDGLTLSPALDPTPHSERL